MGPGPTNGLLKAASLLWLPLATTGVADNNSSAAIGGNSTTAADNNSSSDYDEYDYEYDYDESVQTFNWPELLPALVVYGLTLVLGIVGNALIIFTIGRYRRMKSTTNVFLVSLACADLLLILICIPVKLAKLFSFSWTMGEFLCKAVHYLQNVSAICSVLTLTAMSIERYYAIVHPMKAKYMCTISQARKIIMCIWVAAFLLAVPMLFAQVHMEVGWRVKGYWCVKHWANLPLWRFHEVYMLLLILVVPTTVMAVAYTSICWEIWRVMQQRCDMTTGQGFCKNGNATEESFPLKSSKKTSRTTTHEHNSFKESMKKNALKAEEESKTVKQVIKMLVAIVVLFVICWGPVLIDNVLTAYGVINHIKQGSPKHMYTAFHLMSYFNSCVNPIVYGFMSKNFREGFQKALCACCVRRRQLQRNGTLSQTRTTSVRFGPNAPSGSVSQY